MDSGRQQSESTAGPLFAKQTQQPDTKNTSKYVQTMTVLVPMVTRKGEEIESKFYFGEDTKDFMYQQKYMKLRGKEFSNFKFKTLIGERAPRTIASYLSTALKKNPSTEKLKQDEAFQFEEFIIASLDHGSTAHLIPPEKEKMMRLEELLTRLGFKPEGEEKISMDYDKFFPNFKVIELNGSITGANPKPPLDLRERLLANSIAFKPRDANSSFDKLLLEEWLKQVGEQFVFYHYAMAMLESVNPEAKTKTPKSTGEHREKVDSQFKYHLKEGVKEGYTECVCLFLEKTFRKIHKEPCSELDKKKNLLKFEGAYDLIANTVIKCGILQFRNFIDYSPALLKIFYQLLDCFPDFRLYCLKRVGEVAEFIKEVSIKQGLFKAEIALQENPERVKDIAMFLLLDTDITSDVFLNSLNLLEYLCFSNSKFKFLGLFIGDLTDCTMLGIEKDVDMNKQLTFYEIASSCNFSEIEKGKLLKINVFSRLSVLYRNKFKRRMKELASYSQVSKDQEDHLKPVYKRLYEINEELIKVYHPISLFFYAEHYLRCNQQKIETKPFTPEPGTSFTESVILKRSSSLSQAAAKLNILFNLGDKSENATYFKILEQLKLKEMVYPAIRIAKGSYLENTYMPLAQCIQRGLFGDDKTAQTVKQIYKKVIAYYIEKADLCKIGYATYRMALIFIDGGNLAQGKKFLMISLILLLHSNFSLILKLDPKRFLFTICGAIRKLNKSDLKEEFYFLLLVLAYRFYPTFDIDFTIHYEIEQKLFSYFNTQFISLTDHKNSAAGLIFIEDSFAGECEKMQEFKKLRESTSQSLKSLREKVIETLCHEYREEAEMLGLLSQSVHTLEDDDEDDQVSSTETRFLKVLYRLDENGKLYEGMDASIEDSLKIISTQRDHCGDSLIKTFKEVIEDKVFLDLCKSSENSEWRKVLKSFHSMVQSNKHIRKIDESMITICKDLSIENKYPIGRFPHFKFTTAKFNENSQLCKTMELKKESAQLKNLVKNFDYFFTYNPFLLNYLGISISKPDSSQMDRQIFKIDFYSDYFARTGDSISKKNFIAGEDLPLNKMFEICYQLIHAIRSLHASGTVSYFVNSCFMTLTPFYSLSLIVPFFEDYFGDPMKYIKECDHAIWKYDHLAPEIFKIITAKLTVEEFTIAKEDMKKRCRFFSVLASDPTEKACFTYSSKTDIWSLGIFFTQLFTSKPFFDPKVCTSPQAFFNLITNENALKSYVEGRLELLPKDLPTNIQKTIYSMLRVNPLRRPNINKILHEFESFVFNELFNIAPVTYFNLNRKIFQKVFFSNITEIETHQNQSNITIYLPKGYTFKGDLENGVPSGKGVISLGNKKVLIGQFKNGVMEGMNEFYFSDRGKICVLNVADGYPELPIGNQLSKNAAFIVYDTKGMLDQKEREEIAQFSAKTWIPANVEEKLEKFKWVFDEEIKAKLMNKAVAKPEGTAIKVPVIGLSNPWRLTKEALTFTANVVETIQLKPEQRAIMKEIEESISALESKKNYKFMSYSKKRDVEDLIKQCKEEFGLEKVAKSVTPRPDLERKDSKHHLLLADLENHQQLREVLNDFVGMISQANAGYDSSKDTASIPTLVIDIFGNCIKLRQNTKTKDVDYDQGVVISYLEQFKQFESLAYKYSTSPFLIFQSRIANFSLNDSKIPITNFRDLNSAFTEARYQFSIITEMQKNRPQQYRGVVGAEGPVSGNLYQKQPNFIHLNRSSGQGGASYTGIIVDNENQFKYEGEISGTRKHGFGTLHFKGRKIYVGNFRDGEPHGKGMYYYNDMETLRKDKSFAKNPPLKFKGIFCKGFKKYGTSFYLTDNGKVEVRGVHFYEPPKDKGLNIKVSTAELLGASIEKTKKKPYAFSKKEKLAPKPTPKRLEIKEEVQDRVFQLNDFVKMMNEDLDKYWIEGSIRRTAEPVTYFSKFKGIDLKFNGVVKEFYKPESEGNSLSAFFLGSYSDGKKVGIGMMVDIHNGKLSGNWNGQIVKGRYQLENGETRQGSFNIETPGQFLHYGLGIITKSTSVYNGEIQSNLPNGYGSMITITYGKHRKHQKYEGEFVDEEYHGIGRLEDLINECSYEGTFKNNLLEGYGIFRKKHHSEMYLGFWKEGKMIYTFSESIARPLNNMPILTIMSTVEYNSFENSYTKKGICQVNFLKLIRDKTNPLTDNPFFSHVNHTSSCPSLQI
jgi:hypothetical protein